ncbi:TldD/PmbA family protein [bacterium]|nr:TldD/PmbA family protein [bacterium]
MKYRSVRTAFVSCLFVVLCATTTVQAQDAFLDLLQSELQREYTSLQQQDPPAYFLSYRVVDDFSSHVSASFGALTASEESHNRGATTQVRVGDYATDNTREIRGSNSFDFDFPIPANLPLDGNENGTRLVLWNASSGAYRKAAKKYQQVKANTAVKVEAEDKSDDFARDIKIESYEEPVLDIAPLKPDRAAWERALKKISAVFLECEHIFRGSASLSFGVERKYIVTSEGSRIAENRTSARVMLNATIKCDDGMELPLYQSYFAFKVSDLPSPDVMLADAKKMVETMRAMREAPVTEPYTGPAMLSGRAAGVFFHEIFGHRVEGHRQKSESEGQTFKKMEGKSVLADHMTVLFDPTRRSFEGQDLNGYYVFDDEGVRGQNVEVVGKGVLHDFLMGRTPFEKHPTSNGHGRAASGYDPVSRQSNLIVTTADPVAPANLREQLIEECRKQEKEYGLLFADVQGGFTTTGRFMPNAFNVTPTEVYRVYVDGRPDELVRGVDLVGTPLVMFSNITAAGNDPEVFTGTCGAESGGVPVSAISPSLLVSQIEVQKKSKSQERAPLLQRPDRDNSTTQPSKRTY